MLVLGKGKGAFLGTVPGGADKVQVSDEGAQIPEGSLEGDGKLLILRLTDIRAGLSPCIRFQQFNHCDAKLVSAGP